MLLYKGRAVHPVKSEWRPYTTLVVKPTECNLGPDYYNAIEAWTISKYGIRKATYDQAINYWVINRPCKLKRLWHKIISMHLSARYRISE